MPPIDQTPTTTEQVPETCVVNCTPVSGEQAGNEQTIPGSTEMFIIDPSGRKTDQTSGQSILFQLQEEGWGFVPANNDVMPGISRVTRMIRENRLFIDKNRCPLLVEEIK